MWDSETLCVSLPSLRQGARRGFTCDPSQTFFTTKACNSRPVESQVT